MAISATGHVPLERVYVWQLPVRIAHWALFFSIFTLAATGYYIGHPFIAVPGPARDHFVMGTARMIHLYAAIVFTVSLFVRFYWFLVGNRYARLSDFIPVTGERLRNLLKTFMFYTFLRHDPDDYAGHNALAGATYLVIYAVYLLMIGTGLALYTVYASLHSPFQFFGVLTPLFGGLSVARALHHIGMWVILVFVVVHVYFVLLSSIVEQNGTLGSIFSGYKFVPEDEADSR
jgi:Ni/Fe-hydrogenase 1 B-type cytochrome subunit